MVTPHSLPPPRPCLYFCFQRLCDRPHLPLQRSSSALRRRFLWWVFFHFNLESGKNSFPLYMGGKKVYKEHFLPFFMSNSQEVLKLFCSSGISVPFSSFYVQFVIMSCALIATRPWLCPARLCPTWLCPVWPCPVWRQQSSKKPPASLHCPTVMHMLLICRFWLASLATQLPFRRDALKFKVNSVVVWFRCVIAPNWRLFYILMLSSYSVTPFSHFLLSFLNNKNDNSSNSKSSHLLVLSIYSNHC